MLPAKQKETRQSPDAHQTEWLALQSSLKKETRFSDLALICVFLALLFLAGCAVFFFPDREFSEQENRYLQKAPSFTVDRVLNGKFSSDFADWMSDQFPLRDLLVGVKAACEIALGKGENNGVLLCSDGSLAVREDYPDTVSLAQNIAAARAFADAAPVPVVFAFAGRTQDVNENALPALFDAESNSYLYDAFEKAMDGQNYADLRSLLQNAAEEGEKVCYATDHHWTGKGAYLAYTALGEALGYTPYAEEDFTVEVASGFFYGTSWSSAGMKWVAPDTLEYWRYDGDEDVTVEIPSKKTSFSGFYDRTYLEKKDKYSSFLSGNNALVRVTKNGGEKRQTLLLVKDSFAHSLAPFLARHFDLVLVDLRYYNGSVAELIERENVAKVLILYNAANLCSDTSLSTIR